MHPKWVSDLIARVLREDEVEHDITSRAIFGNGGGLKEGVILAKENLVLSGMGVAREVCLAVSSSIRFRAFKKDGDRIKKGEPIARISGFVSDLLRAERIMLNFLQHLSGVATLTHRFVTAIKPYRSRILDTRKTIPGLRFLEKKAVRDGGGHNHRMSLADQFLIKDNHIDACGGIAQAIERVKAYNEIRDTRYERRKIEIEARNLREVRQAVKAGADIILLDNMKLSQIRKAVTLVKNKCLLEVSGGLNLRNVRKIAQTGVPRISIGALTHSAPAVDLSFRIQGMILK